MTADKKLKMARSISLDELMCKANELIDVKESLAFWRTIAAGLGAVVLILAVTVLTLVRITVR